MFIEELQRCFQETSELQVFQQGQQTYIKKNTKTSI